MTFTVSVVSTARPLSLPAQNARTVWAERFSCIITLESDGTRGQGEAAPLPDFSPDSLQACEAALASVDLRDIPTRLAANQDLLTELARASAQIAPQLPAARTALETALLDLWSRARGVPAWALLVPSGVEPLARPLAALLSGEPEQAVAQALAARARGIETFKFKVGRPSAWPRELAAVQALRAALGPNARLRLDANQTLSVAQASERLRQLAPLQIEFVEEPCAPRERAQLAEFGVPLAADESLATGLFPRRGDRAAILKPTLLGGVTGCISMAQAAHAAGAQVVLSHAFEGPLGLGLSAVLALSLGTVELAHGLDPDGARLDAQDLPWYADATVRAWSAPGLALPVQS